MADVDSGPDRDVAEVDDAGGGGGVEDVVDGGGGDDDAGAGGAGGGGKVDVGVGVDVDAPFVIVGVASVTVTPLMRLIRRCASNSFARLELSRSNDSADGSNQYCVQRMICASIAASMMGAWREFIGAFKGSKGCGLESLVDTSLESTNIRLESRTFDVTR